MVHQDNSSPIRITLLNSSLARIAPLEAGKPILDTEANFASFSNNEHEDNRIGYRFVEGIPVATGAVPESPEQADIDPDQVARLEKEYSTQSSATICRHHETESTGWIRQDWTYYLVPQADGIDMLWIVETHKQGLPRYFIVQQCFRMSGKRNAAWRRKIAETSAFSEYDLWSDQEDDSRKTSLSYAIRKGRWESLPYSESVVCARTPLGIGIDLTDKELLRAMGDVNPFMVEPVDCGLVARTDSVKKWICGIFWEGTSHVTNHHPADCLHCFVNIGNVPAYTKRAIRGKIYWFKGTLDELQSRWRKEFQEKD